jgi:hypothetical protein
MAPDYVTVYQISKESSDWSFALVGFIPLIAGLIILVGKRRFKWKKPHWLLPIFFCGFGVLWLYAAGMGVLQALSGYQKGDYLVVEGQVTDFHPMPYEGHQMECFTVQEQHFCYSDYVMDPGFRHTASHGGPIRSGLQVRIAYTGGTILRLDIPRAQAPTAAESSATVKANEKEWQARSERDPIKQRMNTAFLFAAVCITLWWNLQWKRVMQFWLQPPNRRATQYGFRVFFALNLMGAIGALIRQLRLHPLTRETFFPTIEVTAVMLAVTGAMSAFALWSITRGQVKREQDAAPKKP